MKRIAEISIYFKLSIGVVVILILGGVYVTHYFMNSVQYDPKLSLAGAAVSGAKTSGNLSLSSDNINQKTKSASTSSVGSDSPQDATASPAPTAPTPASPAPPQLPAQAPPQVLADRTAVIAACNQAKDAYISSKQAGIDQIEAQHSAQLQSIGLGSSDLAQADIGAENIRYHNELTAFESDYQQKVVSYVCI
jgi:cytoskeletal protein RodZ